MRDFELAAIAYIAWVLLYHESYSRAQYRVELKCYETGDKFIFILEKGLNWEIINFKDYNYDYHIENEGRYDHYDFKVKHSYAKNEFQFKKKGDEFEVTDKFGKRLEVKLMKNKEQVRILAFDYPKGKYTFEVR